MACVIDRTSLRPWRGSYRDDDWSPQAQLCDRVAQTKAYIEICPL